MKRAMSCLAIGALCLASAARAQAPVDPSPAEAVGDLFFGTPFMAMNKTVENQNVIWTGNALVQDADHLILSIAPGRINPCVFEAFFVEATGPLGDKPAVLHTAYAATIDVRKPVEAALKRADKPAVDPGDPVATLVIHGPSLFCSRATTFEPGKKMSLYQACIDSVEDDVAESVKDRLPRLTKALAVLRAACRW